MSLQLERKYKINNFLGKKFKVEDYFDESDIINKMNDFLDHYEKYGNRHHNDFPDWKILDKYYDDMIEDLVSELEIALNDADQEVFIEWVCSIYG